MENWRGRAFTSKEVEEFSLDALLKQPCSVGIEERISAKGNAYEVVKSASPAYIDDSIIQDLEITKFDFDEFFDTEILKSLPSFVTYNIKNSKEFSELSEDCRPLLKDDEVPF